jgi:hypothetical protein
MLAVVMSHGYVSKWLRVRANHALNKRKNCKWGRGDIASSIVQNPENIFIPALSKKAVK